MFIILFLFKYLLVASSVADNFLFYYYIFLKSCLTFKYFEFWLFYFGCYFQTIFPSTVMSDIWRKCFGVTNPRGLALFPSFSLVYRSLSANGCGLLKGVVEGSAWNLYPDEVHGHRVALSHALCPAWIKHTQIHSDKSLSIHLCLAASPRASDVPYQCIDAWHKLFYDHVEAVCFLIWALMSVSLSFSPTLLV